MPRDSNGTYSLPAGNPVVTETVIASAWANTTMSDIGTALTDSLDRAGSGPMTGQLKIANGLIGAPGLAFGTEPTSGLYRNAAGDHRYSISSNDVLQLSAAVTRVFSTQFQVTNGAVGTPAVAYASETNGGWYRNGAADHRYSISAADVIQIAAGALRTVDGSVGTPALSFISDTNLGWRRAGADDMRIVANGADVLQISTAGIAVTGAATVSTTLGVTGNATFAAYNKFTKTGGSGSPAIQISAASPVVLEWQNTGGGSDGKNWEEFVNGATHNLQATSDDHNSGLVLRTITRTGIASAIYNIGPSGGVVAQYLGREIGWRGLNSNSQAAGYTFVAGDAGRAVGATSSGNFTINTGVFAADDVVTFINTTGANCTIIQGAGVTLRLMGSSGTTGSRTVANHGVATIISQNGTVFLVGGPGVT